MDELTLNLSNIDKDNLYEVIKVLKESNRTKIEKVSQNNKVFVRKYYLNDYLAENEYLLLSDLSHPCLPKIYDHYSLSDRTVIIEEFIDGTKISDYVSSRTKLTYTQAIDIVLKLCSTVVFLHDRKVPIIHRDIKPDNIIYTADGNVKLIDFNIARTYKPDNIRDTVYMGTIGYSPPEQFGFGQTDVRSDIYSIGKTLLFLLSGVNPGRECDDHLYEDIPSNLCKIIKKSTNFAPEARYESIKEMMKELSVIKSKTICLSRPDIWATFKSLTRRNFQCQDVSICVENPIEATVSKDRLKTLCVPIFICLFCLMLFLVSAFNVVTSISKLFVPAASAVGGKYHNFLRNDKDDYLELIPDDKDKNKGTFSDGFLDGSYSISDEILVLNYDLIDFVIKLKIHKNYLISIYDYSGHVPEKNRFDASFTAPDSIDIHYVFRENGTMERKGSMTYTGSYIRDGNIITVQDDKNNYASSKFFVYEDIFCDTVYIKTDDSAVR